MRAEEEEEQWKMTGGWEGLSPGERNRAVALDVAGWQPQHTWCTGTLVEAVLDSGWWCLSCGLTGDWDEVPLSGEERHLAADPPRYSEHWDALFPLFTEFVGQHCTRVYATPDTPRLPAASRVSEPVWERFTELMAEEGYYLESGNVYRWVATWTPALLARAMLEAVLAGKDEQARKEERPV